MKRERAYIDERRRKLLEIVRNNQQIRIEELAVKLQVSMLTIRRDLQYLQDQKQLVCVRGGAAFPESESWNPEEAEDDERNRYQRLIARYAAEFVEEGDTLFVNSSANALQMLEYIRAANVTVITNNGLAVQAKYSRGVNLILTGGEVRHNRNVMAGDFAVRNLQTVYAGKAFLGCSGISAHTGLTTEAAGEVEINQLMIRNSGCEVYVLADYRKIGRESGFISAPVRSIRHLVTDEKAPAEAIAGLQAAGVQIHQVHKGDFKE